MDLQTYIENNREHIIDYHSRRLSGHCYTSNLAESSVNSQINSRQKQNQKMQWTRDGAHNILQIRTSLYSKKWGTDWRVVQNSIYREAA